MSLIRKADDGNCVEATCLILEMTMISKKESSFS